MMIVAALGTLVIIGAVALAVGLQKDDSSSKKSPRTASAKHKTFTVSGKLALTDEEMMMPLYDQIASTCDFDDHSCVVLGSEPCAPESAGYSDIAAGTQVVVTDSSGRTIALGSLQSGRTEYMADAWDTGNNGNDAYPPCYFPFTISDVPDKSGIYGIQISHRGVVQFTRSQADSLTITLGD